MTRQVVRFAGIGVASTVAYLALFAALRLGLSAQAANGLALVLCAVANTAANRRLTFGVRGRRHAGRQHMQALAVFGLGLALTSGSLWLLAALDPTPARLTEVAVLVLANLAATASRFALLRFWVFALRPAAVDPVR